MHHHIRIYRWVNDRRSDLRLANLALLVNKVTLDCLIQAAQFSQTAVRDAQIEGYRQENQKTCMELNRISEY